MLFHPGVLEPVQHGDVDLAAPQLVGEVRVVAADGDLALQPGLLLEHRLERPGGSLNDGVRQPAKHALRQADLQRLRFGRTRDRRRGNHRHRDR